MQSVKVLNPEFFFLIEFILTNRIIQYTLLKNCHFSLGIQNLRLSNNLCIVKFIYIFRFEWPGKADSKYSITLPLCQQGEIHKDANAVYSSCHAIHQPQPPIAENCLHPTLRHAPKVRYPRCQRQKLKIVRSFCVFGSKAARLRTLLTRASFKTRPPLEPAYIPGFTHLTCKDHPIA